MNIVRIMPRQPIEAERINRPPAFRSLGREVLHHDGHETFLSARYWHEVSDPIVWDGSEEAYDEVCAALEHSESNLRVHIDGPDYAEWLDIEDGSTLTTVGIVVPNARIRIEGDSFAILPPEVTP